MKSTTIGKVQVLSMEVAESVLRRDRVIVLGGLAVISAFS